MYIWQLNKHVGDELKSHNHVEMGYFKAPVSLKDPQMSAEEEITSLIQQREAATKASTFLPAAYSLFLMA